MTEPATASRAQRAVLARYAAAALPVRLADEMVPVAIVLLALAATGSAALAGTLVAAYTLPALVSGPLLGAWLDQTPWRRAALAVDALVLALAAGGLALGLGRMPHAAAIALAALAGLTLPLTGAGFTSLVPRLVPPARLARGNALDATTFNVAAIGGPALAGALAAASGARAATAAIAVVALGGAVATGLLPRADLALPGDGAPSGLLAATRAGLAQLVRAPALRGATAASVLGYGCVGVLGVALPLYAAVLGAREEAAGALWAALEAGALAGTLAAARWPPPLSPQGIVIGGTTLFGLALATWPLAASLPLALALVAVAGVVQGPVLPALFAVRQQHAPPALLAQVSMTGASLKIAAYSAGAALGGWLVPALGARGALVVVAVGQLVAAGVGAALARERSR